jgi:hypothetical protein
MDSGGGLLLGLWQMYFALGSGVALMIVEARDVIS